jgi:phosphatidylinositol glycan class V
MFVLRRLYSIFLQHSHDSSIKSLLVLALGVRILLWLFMALVCALVPSHNPGDDVMRFDLRMMDEGGAAGCFSEPNTFCECGDSCTWGRETKGCHEATAAGSGNVLQTRVFALLLEPLTRWDAARFLHLAHRPQLRLPYPDTPEVSELAHAFSPTFPAAIQLFTRVLLLLPRALLPFTCEGTMVLAAWILNSGCFLVALYSLYHATHCLLRQHGVDERTCRIWSNRVGLLFLFNPALVFFSTTYSESMFAALVFSGTYLMTLWGPLGAIVPWILATATRSNGILYSGYLMLYGAGKALQSPTTRLQKVTGVGLALLGASLIISPLYRYNQHALAVHCNEHGDLYKWCDQAQSSPTFYLYGYIQRKHWNVGFLRYYELKQIPNFLLAAPILVLSFVGVSHWIQRSWRSVASANDKPWWEQTVWWAWENLRLFASPVVPQTTDAVHILLGPSVLGHYAVWAVAALLGLTTAHVQISTRLICSSCPALYWYVACLVTTSEQWGSIYLAYCLVFIFLGGILYPMWLPWT